MKKYCLLAIAVAATPLMAQAEITVATLYPSHAELTWEESEQVSSGAGTFEVEGLPVSLQDQSLQVVLEGVPGSQIRQVQVSRVEQAEFVAGESRRIRDELAAVSLRIQEQEDSIRAWNQQVTLMSKAAESPHELSASELNDMAAALKDTTQNALAEIRRIRVKLADDIAIRDRLSRELAQVKQSAKATKKVSLRYQAPTAGELQVKLRFQTTEASWRSEYTARLKSRLAGESGGEVMLEHLAVVQQATGTDWQGVELQLATANARRGIAMPPLYSWVVNPEPPQVYRSKALAPMAEMQADSLMESSAVVERQSTFTQSYRLQQPVDVPSGAAGQRLSVAEHRVPVEVAIWTAPVQNTTGYVHATGTFQSEAPIPAGRVTLYRDGQSVGESRLPELTSGEELTLGFGVDEGIRVAVVNELERTGEEGVWKSENVQRRQNRFEITNHHSEPVQVRIFDRLPVSQKDTLTVKPLEISEPVERDVDDKKGVLAWNREVSAGQTVLVKSGFEIRVPEGTALPRL
ncbi:DUF4139 domain-containing protein [Marinobacter sp. 1_MG-2023]|uniref:DUF4139 domain-containing protein n=1 Tax=Marinobacter sp. 1_MG-2023 TaxID=3062627 RepID=UPI0026E17E33|nr:DUF4139 domain-containing protein [Marinobacter sp. 1_MG-2023]MDO6824984.1 DUF4139 domain-containing protein [Marinobacter sp. 1_MG-2023]